jgi:hypothetical protein
MRSRRHAQAEATAIMTEGIEPLLLRHGDAQRVLGLGASAYFKLIREKKLTVVGRGRMARCYYPSIRDYVSRMLAEKAA